MIRRETIAAGRFTAVVGKNGRRQRPTGLKEMWRRQCGQLPWPAPICP